MIQFASTVLLSEAFKKQILNYDQNYQTQLKAAGDPNDGNDTVVLLDVNNKNLPSMQITSGSKQIDHPLIATAPVGDDLSSYITMLVQSLKNVIAENA